MKLQYIARYSSTRVPFDGTILRLLYLMALSEWFIWSYIEQIVSMKAPDVTTNADRSGWYLCHHLNALLHLEFPMDENHFQWEAFWRKVGEKIARLAFPVVLDTSELWRHQKEILARAIRELDRNLSSAHETPGSTPPGHPAFSALNLVSFFHLLALLDFKHGFARSPLHDARDHGSLVANIVQALRTLVTDGSWEVNQARATLLGRLARHPATEFTRMTAQLQEYARHAAQALEVATRGATRARVTELKVRLALDSDLGAITASVTLLPSSNPPSAGSPASTPSPSTPSPSTPSPPPE